MGSAKKQALELIQQLPEESSLEDIQYHLYVRSTYGKKLSEAFGT